MLDRIRHPNAPAKDRDLGPAYARRHPWHLMRRTVDDAPPSQRPER